jgi:hypothetical protein
VKKAILCSQQTAKSIPKHPDRIDLDDPEEIRYCRGQLVMAVAKVGYTTTAVEQELQKRA